MSEQGLTNVLLIVLATLLSGCVGILGDETIAGQQACAAHGGVRVHFPTLSKGFDVKCEDGVKIQGEIK
jgi:hypothetical protein